MDVKNFTREIYFFLLKQNLANRNIGTRLLSKKERNHLSAEIGRSSATARWLNPLRWNIPHFNFIEGSCGFIAWWGVFKLRMQHVRLRDGLILSVHWDECKKPPNHEFGRDKIALKSDKMSLFKSLLASGDC